MEFPILAKKGRGRYRGKIFFGGRGRGQKKKRNRKGLIASWRKNTVSQIAIVEHCINNVGKS